MTNDKGTTRKAPENLFHAMTKMEETQEAERTDPDFLPDADDVVDEAKDTEIKGR